MGGGLEACSVLGPPEFAYVKPPLPRSNLTWETSNLPLCAGAVCASLVSLYSRTEDTHSHW